MKVLALLAAAVGIAAALPTAPSSAPAVEPATPAEAPVAKEADAGAAVVPMAAVAPGTPVTPGTPVAPETPVAPRAPVAPAAEAEARDLAARAGRPHPGVHGFGRTIAAIPGLGFGIGIEGNPYGAKAYGMGLNNPWATRPNPWAMDFALEVTRTFPNTLVRVDVDGEIAITDRFGQEIPFFEL